MSISQLSGRRVFVSGHRGMVGSAVVRALHKHGVENIITQTSDEIDLRNQQETNYFFQEEQPEVVIFAAGKVGGIQANDTYPVEFLSDNILMAVNAINAAYAAGTGRFLYLGSTCIYPQMAPQPIQEDSLMTSALEQTNEAYALAKIAGLKLCQYYRRQYGALYHSAMPTNLYGPGDNYHLENSHVLPALLRRFHEAVQADAPSVTIWGTGSPRREFLHVDDLASALLHLVTIDDPPDWVNVGTGSDISILGLAELIAEVTGFSGEILTDTSKPDGTPRKLADCSRLTELGWRPTIALREGIQVAYACFQSELGDNLLREA